MVRDDTYASVSPKSLDKLPALLHQRKWGKYCGSCDARERGNDEIYIYVVFNYVKILSVSFIDFQQADSLAFSRKKLDIARILLKSNLPLETILLRRLEGGIINSPAERNDGGGREETRD